MVGSGELIFQHVIFGTQLSDQGKNLFDFLFERSEFGIHGAHYRGVKINESRTKRLFSKCFIAR